jgi:phospholipid/cholesterol/gamma-HCH transport system permease protein
LNLNFGRYTVSVLEELSSMVWFVIETMADITDRLQRRRMPFGLSHFFAQADRVGVSSIPLVAVVSLFLGLTSALLTGNQLKRFGTEGLVPGLVAISFTRELGPLITGIVIAARIGAAFTAELGTMTVGEEVDAIESMGISPLRYLAAPRCIAIFFLLPCLSTVSCVAALIGAAFISNLQLNISFGYFQDSVMSSLYIRDIVSGIIKSLLFGAIIGVISCYKGLSVKHGAESVGISTTSSVVTAITTVIGSDAVYNVIFVRLFE